MYCKNRPKLYPHITPPSVCPTVATLFVCPKELNKSFLYMVLEAHCCQHGELSLIYGLCEIARLLLLYIGLASLRRDGQERIWEYQSIILNILTKQLTLTHWPLQWNQDIQLPRSYTNRWCITQVQILIRHVLRRQAGFWTQNDEIQIPPLPLLGSEHWQVLSKHSVSASPTINWE